VCSEHFSAGDFNDPEKRDTSHLHLGACPSNTLHQSPAAKKMKSSFNQVCFYFLEREG
jgi:hypothetical protein